MGDWVYTGQKNGKEIHMYTTNNGISFFFPQGKNNNVVLIKSDLGNNYFPSVSIFLMTMLLLT